MSESGFGHPSPDSVFSRPSTGTAPDLTGDPAFRSHSAISPAGYSNARLMVKRE
jgi:hypothetical protein